MKSELNCFLQIKNARKIAIFTHKNADTDALASCIALRRIIKENFEEENKKIIIDIFTDTQTFNKKDEDLIKNENINHQSYKRYDLSIALDCASVKMLGCYEKQFKNKKNTLSIDHHATNTKFALNNIVSPMCSSTCEMIYLIFIKLNKLTCTAQTLGVIYSGIITDTNNLTQNVGEKTYNVVDAIIKTATDYGLNLEQIRNHYFKSNTKEQNALLSRALDSITYASNEKIAIMKLTKQDFDETKTTRADTIGIVDHTINTQGVEVGVIFIKKEDNTYYVSLRSKNENINVGQIAKSMGGGGHTKVAAFETKPEDNLTDIKAKLISLCNDELSKTVDETDDISALLAETPADNSNQ